MPQVGLSVWLETGSEDIRLSGQPGTPQGDAVQGPGRMVKKEQSHGHSQGSQMFV